MRFLAAGKSGIICNACCAAAAVIFLRGYFPNEASITRLIGAVLLEQNDEWLLQHRYMQIEGMAELTPPLIDADAAKLPPLAA